MAKSCDSTQPSHPMPFPPARSASASLPRCAAAAAVVNAERFYTLFPIQLHYHPLPSLYPRLLFSRRGARSYLRCASSSAHRAVLGFPRLVSTPSSSSSSRHTFSSTRPAAMAATKIDGTQIAKNIREGLKTEIRQIQESNPRFKPSLVIFQGAS